MLGAQWLFDRPTCMFSAGFLSAGVIQYQPRPAGSLRVYVLCHHLRLTTVQWLWNLCDCAYAYVRWTEPRMWVNLFRMMDFFVVVKLEQLATSVEDPELTSNECKTLLISFVPCLRVSPSLIECTFPTSLVFFDSSCQHSNLLLWPNKILENGLYLGK
jgi:hypothetical protein